MPHLKPLCALPSHATASLPLPPTSSPTLSVTATPFTPNGQSHTEAAENANINDDNDNDDHGNDGNNLGTQTGEYTAEEWQEWEDSWMEWNQIRPCTVGKSWKHMDDQEEGYYVKPYICHI